MDSQRTLTEQQTVLEQQRPAGVARPMGSANEFPAKEQVQVAVPVDPITLEPRTRNYPAMQPRNGL